MFGWLVAEDGSECNMLEYLRGEAIWKDLDGYSERDKEGCAIFMPKRMQKSMNTGGKSCIGELRLGYWSTYAFVSV